MQELLSSEELSSEELEIVLREREAGKVDFLLVDVREPSEYEAGHLAGVDLLRPTSTFSEWAQILLTEMQERTIIFTCRTGARSGQVQRIFKDNGHTAAINHAGGIFSYRGKIESMA